MAISPVGTEVEHTADRLAKVLAELRRITRRRVRSVWGQTPLSPSQVELLRLVAEQPGIGVGNAADELQLAPNTVSTLVRSLTERGLLERERDERDGRAARLHITSAAVRRRAAWRDHRTQVMTDALRSLEPVDREAIGRALPALARLAEQLGEAS